MTIFSIVNISSVSPKIFRRYFFYNLKLLDKLSQCAAKSISKPFILEKHGRVLFSGLCKVA